jgi:putative transposase
LCNNCGTLKKDLKRSDRVYHCACGHHCDRDLNASYNLRDYQAV